MRSYWTISYLEAYFLLFFILCSSSLFSQNFNAQVEAIINVDDSKSDILEIRGVAKNATETTFSLYYELSVIKTNPAGNSSKNKQTGRVTLEAYETKALSRTSVNIEKESKTIILLLVYNEEKELLGTDRLVYLGLESTKEETVPFYLKENDGIDLTSMVTENTKTKPGKDFYDFFYQQYNLSPEKINAIIHIDEHISFGRTTRIMVKVDDKIIYQFYARPKLDYLKDQAGIAIQQLNKYLHFLENRNEYKNQF